MKMERIESSETSALKAQTPEITAKKNTIRHSAFNTQRRFEIMVFLYVYFIFISPYYNRCTDYGTDRTMQGSNPGMSKKCISSPKHVEIPWIPLSLLFNWYRGLMAWHKMSVCVETHTAAALLLEKKCGTC